MVVATLTLRLRQSSLSAPSLFMGGVGSSCKWLWESNSKIKLERAAEQTRLGEAQLNQAADLARLREAQRNRAELARLDEAADLARLDKVRRKQADERYRSLEAAEKDRQKQAATEAMLSDLKARQTSPSTELQYSKFWDLLENSLEKLRKELKRVSPDDANVFAQELLATSHEFLIVELAPHLTANDAFAYAKYFAAMGLSGQSERYIVGFLSTRLTPEQALDVAKEVMDSTFDTAKYAPVDDEELELQQTAYATKVSILESLKKHMNVADTLTFSGSTSGLPRERAIGGTAKPWLPTSLGLSPREAMDSIISE